MGGVGGGERGGGGVGSLGFPKGSIRDNLKSKTGNPYRGIYKFTALSRLFEDRRPRFDR